MKRFVILLIMTFFFISCSADSDVDGIQYDGYKPFIESSEYIALFGDVQYYTNSKYYNLYQYSCEWILTQKNIGMNINCVVHTGDCTQSNTGGNWEYFYSPTMKLANEIPFFSLIGDHDYTWDSSGRINDRNDTHFNEYVQFPLSTHKVVGQFEEGHMENIIVKNHIHGVPVYLLILEFGPRKEVVEWADQYVKTHPDINFIMMTHEYLEMGGGRRTQKLKSQTRLRNTTYLVPDELWNQLVKCNNNIICVFCGHVGGLYALTVETNNYGREIPQIQHNIQSSTYRYDNWLMLWEFPLYSDSVNVSIINTKTHEYFNDNPVLFKFRYRYIDQPTSVTRTLFNRGEYVSAYDLNGRKRQNVNEFSGITVKNRKKIILH